jgi:selenide,water dikinase
MLKLNDIGVRLASISGVTAMTDVTGFGVLGHLLEVCRGSGVAARLNMRALPVLDDCVHEYRERGAVPGGSARNWRSYGAAVTGANAADQQLLCDPQTSGGLLIAVRPEARNSVVAMLDSAGCSVQPIGELLAQDAAGARIEVFHQ